MAWRHRKASRKGAESKRDASGGGEGGPYHCRPMPEVKRRRLKHNNWKARVHQACNLNFSKKPERGARSGPRLSPDLSFGVKKRDPPRLFSPWAAPAVRRHAHAQSGLCPSRACAELSPLARPSPSRREVAGGSSAVGQDAEAAWRARRGRAGQGLQRKPACAAEETEGELQSPPSLTVAHR